MIKRLIMCGLILAIAPAHLSAAEEKAAEIVAAQVRAQGHHCENPVKAKRDHEASKPDHAVWILECQNAVYRVGLTPDMRATIKHGP